MKLTADLRHQLMMRPYAEIVRRTGADLPELPFVWDRAWKMFGSVMARIGSTISLSKKRLKQSERFELMLWLRPVEDLVRSWLVTRAITWLLMSNAGRKLLYEKLRALRRRPHKISIPYPGWYTIAQHRRFGPEPPPQPAMFQRRDPTDPQNWGGRFQALPAPVKTTARKSTAEVEEDAAIVIARTRTDLSAARRIEMIARVMAKPDAAIRRIGKQIARLPLKTLKDRDTYFVVTSLWMHGEQEFVDVRVHERCAINAFYRAIEAG